MAVNLSDVKLHIRSYVWFLVGLTIGALTMAWGTDGTQEERFWSTFFVGFTVVVIVFVVSILAQVFWIKFVHRIKQNSKNA